MEEARQQEKATANSGPGSLDAPPEAGAKLDVTSDPAQAKVAEPAQGEPERPPRKYRRRIGLPIFLFLLTCFSTFLAGSTQFITIPYVAKALGIGMNSNGWPVAIEPSAMPLRRMIYTHWESGLIYMGCVLAILLTHEMGHFLMAVLYRVRASFPYFIPLPISPIGTMGAVIAMDSRIANRRQIFDIGVAGPIAGLVVALPIMWYGVLQMDVSPGGNKELSLQLPLAMRLLIDYTHPGQYDANAGFDLTRTNPWFMAGWVGLLVTGLNMLPVSQLDGGHVTYALFGKKAHWIARGFMAVALVYLGFMYFAYAVPPGWVLMIALVLLIGTDHPPTRDDTAELGPLRTIIGYASLLIPVFCFVPNLQI
jgi:hypothetical protein